MFQTSSSAIVSVTLKFLQDNSYMLLQKKPLNMMYPTTIFTNYLTSVSIHLIPERKFHLLSTSIARI